MLQVKIPQIINITYIKNTKAVFFYMSNLFNAMLQH
jgi:hypothetical protein